ncbi:MAG: T9SS type A sorting domain-containing protein, partial [Flavobacteriales bacterium]
NVSNMTSLGYADIFISKLNANGDFIWAKQIGNTSFSYGFEEEIELVLDGNDNILMTGWFYDSADFDPSSGVLELTTSGGTDMFAVKLDPNGALVWAKRVGTNGSGGQVVGEGISTDATGQVYLTGRFNSVADFDPGAGLNQIPSTSNDVFVLKLSSNGDFVWVRKVLGNQDDTGKAIVTAPDGTSYITGGFEGTADFDNSLGTYNMTATGTNARDCFVLRLDTDGNFDWAFKVGSIYTELGNAIDLDASGTVHVLGFYDDPESSSYPDIDFDPGAGTFYLATSATGSRGFFLEKLSQTSPVGVSETSQSELAIVYPNPTEGNFSINVKGANTLNIYDATGKLVQTESLKSNAVGNYHLAGPSGIYFVQVIGLDGSVKSSKVVKR